jgi:hypothetical protein
MRLALVCLLTAAVWLQAEGDGTIEGVVRHGQTGKPLRNAEVVIRERSDSGVSGLAQTRAFTDETGRFVFHGVDPGSYDVQAWKAGFLALGTDSMPMGIGGSSISVRDRERVGPLAIRLQPQAVLSGRVTNLEGEPLAGVSVEVWRYRPVNGKQAPFHVVGTHTNDLGEYRVAALAAGRYFVKATWKSHEQSVSAGAGGSETYLPAYFPPDTNPENTKHVTLSAGGTLRGMKIVMARGRTYRIRGKLAGFQPGDRVRVTLVSTEGLASPGALHGAADSNGDFRIGNVRPGPYLLAASGKRGTSVLMGLLPVTVRDGDVEGVTIPLRPGGSVSGRVRVEGDTDGKKGAGVSLEIVSRDGILGRALTAPPWGLRLTRTSEDGSFLAGDLPPVRVTVKGMFLPRGHYVRSIRLGDEDVTTSGVDLSVGTVVTGLEVLVAPGAGELRGKVTGDTGEPARNAAVLVRDTGGRVKQATSGQDGEFRLLVLAPGEYSLLAFRRMPVGPADNTDLWKQHAGDVQRVVIPENGVEIRTLKAILPAEAFR